MTTINVKKEFSQGRKIERTMYLPPPKEANTIEVWNIQKHVYRLADASRYWYL